MLTTPDRIQTSEFVRPRKSSYIGRYCYFDRVMLVLIRYVWRNTNRGFFFEKKVFLNIILR